MNRISTLASILLMAAPLMAVAQQLAPQSLSSGFYYSKPAGAMYRNQGADQLYFPYKAESATYLIMPAWSDATFADRSTSTDGHLWYTGTLPFSTDVCYQTTGTTLTLQTLDGTPQPAPWLCPTSDLEAINAIIGSEDFYPTQMPAFCAGFTTNNNWQNYPAYADCYTRLAADSIGALGFLDDMCNSYLVQWGSSSAWTGNLYAYGSCSYSQSGRQGRVSRVYQDYPAPASPLYVEQIILHGMTSRYQANEDGSYDPIAPLPTTEEGEDSLYIRIYSIETGAELAVLSCTPSNGEIAVRPGVQPTTNVTSRGIMNVVYTFTRKEYSGWPPMEHTVPFVIDEPFRLEVEGLDQDDIDVGLMGYKAQDQDAEAFRTDDGKYRRAHSVITLTDGTEYTYPATEASTLNDLKVLYATFIGMMDQVEVVTQYEDGTALVHTGTAWSDGQTMMPFYELAGNIPSWVTGFRYSEVAPRQYLLQVVTEEAAVGEEPGTADLYLKGRGITSTGTIHVVQQAAQSGIESISSDAPVPSTRYTLSGRRAGASERGILIEGGRIVSRQ